MKKIFIAFTLFILTAASAFAAAEIKLIPDKLYAPSETITVSDDGSADIKQELMNYLCTQLRTLPESIDVSDFNISIKPEIAAEKKITITGAQISYDDFFDILVNAVYNTPELGYVMSGHNGYYYNNNGLITEFLPYYITAPFDKEEFETEIDFILSSVISADMSDTEKLLVLHDYLVDSCVYNIAASEKKVNAADEYAYAYTAYGAIVKKTCVCQGYSLAMKLFCDRLGIDCGYAVNSGHIWNIARATNGKLYHIDITYDDPIYTDSSEEDGYAKNEDGSLFQLGIHLNFLTNDETIYEAHSTANYTETADSVSTTYDTAESKLVITDNPASTFPWYNLYGRAFRQDGELWMMCEGIIGNKLYPTPKPIKFSDTSYTDVSADSFPTNRRLAGQIFNVICDADDNYYAALSGTPNSTTSFYEVTYNGNTLSSVKLTPVTFDQKGRAFADVDNPSAKLMLLADSFSPAAYARQSDRTLW